MATPSIRAVLLKAVSVWLFFPAALPVLSDPIIVDFRLCSNASFFAGPSVPFMQVECCPPAPTEQTTIIEGLPPPIADTLRVRLSAQCTDAAYAKKLHRAYALMKALPDDDPRSFYQQSRTHCAYCGAAFFYLNSTGGIAPGIDIHFSWLFYPWHRLYLYFHERILAHLLGDPTFSLSFWNWDSGDITTEGWSKTGSKTKPSCAAVGHNFPKAYSRGAAYDDIRSIAARGLEPVKFPDLSYAPILPRRLQTLVNSSAQTVARSNLGVMKTAMVTGATTSEIFLGRTYRAGAMRGLPLPGAGASSLESTGHVAVHFWTGQDDPPFLDMGPFFSSAKDPVFFSHHSNVDRLWEVWKSISERHKDSTDPDWLNAQFQFYDEHSVLRKVNVSDALDTRKLGYVYQEVDDAAWLDFEPRRCTNMSYSETIVQAKLLPVPTPDSNGSYHFASFQPFIFLMTQPESNGLELFITVANIKVAGMAQTGFDVFLNWLNPLEIPESASCSEYAGRFLNTASPSGSMGPAAPPEAEQGLVFQSSISVPLERTGVPQRGTPEVVVVLVPLSTMAADLITFSSISIGPVPDPFPFT